MLPVRAIAWLSSTVDAQCRRLPPASLSREGAALLALHALHALHALLPLLASLSKEGVSVWDLSRVSLKPSRTGTPTTSSTWARQARIGRLHRFVPGFGNEERALRNADEE